MPQSPELLKKIGVLTSGGDAPGMNAAIRAVVRRGLAKGLEVTGIISGYEGVLRSDFLEMNARSVSNIIQRGGTILKTSRCKEFESEAGLRKAAANLSRAGMQGLVVIGGNGSFRGAMALSEFWKGRVVGVPGTIDNDLFGTTTIGYDTAVNTAVEAVDKVRDTADSHERFFIVEVMGRHAGFIALDTGIAGGAEEVAVPERHTSIQAIADHLLEGWKKGKLSNIVIVAEGDHEGGAYKVAEKLKIQTGHDNRVVVLGHMQRGGCPTGRDRILATKLGAYAVDCLVDGKHLVMSGEFKEELVAFPLEDAVNRKKPLDTYLLSLLKALSS